MYIRKQHRKTWFEYARTEVVQNTFSPEWNTKFTIRYNFEERQVIKYSDCPDSPVLIYLTHTFTYFHHTQLYSTCLTRTHTQILKHMWTFTFVHLVLHFYYSFVVRLSPHCFDRVDYVESYVQNLRLGQRVWKPE